MPYQITKTPLYDLLQQLKSEIFKGLRVCVPGSIASVNQDGTVNVNVLLMQNVATVGLPAGLDTRYPQLLHCPVFTLQGGGVGAVMPVAVNDQCLVVFADRCIAGWIKNGAAVPLPSLRMHDISDGFVLVGINSQAPGDPLLTPLAANEGGICETKNENGAAVVVNSLTHLISIFNGTQNLATTLAALVTAIGSLNTALGVLNTAIAGESAVIPSAASAALGNEAAIAAVVTALTAVQTQLTGLLY